MKRFFLSALALVTVIASCTKSDVVETSPSFKTPIQFESYTGKAPMTKATVTTITSVQADGFHATGFIHDANDPYLDKDLTYSADTKAWSFSDNSISYWPAEGTMDFVAYGSNANKTATVNNLSNTSLISFASGEVTQFTYSVPDKVAEQEDLVVAPAKLNQAKIAKVIFDFKHVLSKVGFSVVANTDNDADQVESNDVMITIKNIVLNGAFNNKGTVNLKSETPSISPNTTSTVTSYSLFDSSYAKGTSGTESYNGFVCESKTTTQPIYINTTFVPGDMTADPTLPAVGTDGVPTDATLKGNYDSRYLMIMPGTVSDLTGGTKPYIEVIYELTEGKEESAKVWLTKDGTSTGDNWVFEGGKAYEFVLKISTAAIGFTVDVNPWVDYYPVKDNEGNVTDNGVSNLTPIE